MSHITIEITILSLFSGYINQAVNSGSIFGIATVPKNWLPYLNVVGTFVAGFAATSAADGAIDDRSVIAGLTALSGMSVGVVIHSHLTGHLLMRRSGSPPPNAK
jgi:hypothetical protein